MRVSADPEGWAIICDPEDFPEETLVYGLGCVTFCIEEARRGQVVFARQVRRAQERLEDRIERAERKRARDRGREPEGGDA